MDLQTYKNEIIVAIVTFILVKIPELFKWSKEKETKGLEFVVDFLKSEMKKVKESLDELKIENENLRKKISILQYQITVAETAHFESPFPMWLKDMNNKMISLNQAYEDNFLKPLGFRMADYIGYEDSKIWGDKVANNFKKYDDLALKNDIWTESDNEASKLHPLLEGWLFVKYKRKIQGIAVGIAGIAIPLNKNLLKQ